MKKRKAGRKEYWLKMFEAELAAWRTAEKCTPEQCRESLLEHWPPVLACIERMLALGGDSTSQAISMAEEIMERFESMANGRPPPPIERFFFQMAQRVCRGITRYAREQPPPAWLAELAALEYEVPWLMVNGKPAPGFDEADAALAWGRTFTKRGKSCFDAPRTRAVAWALRSLAAMRTFGRAGQTFEIDYEDYRTVPETLLRLPPLSRKTAAQWWPFVRAVIWPRAFAFVAREAQGQRIVLKKDTPAARREAFLKDCKKAFFARCPADAPGDKSPDSSPRPVVCATVPDSVQLSRKQEAGRPLAKPKGTSNADTATRSAEKRAAGHGGNARRSPRNHGGRHRGEGRAR